MKTHNGKRRLPRIDAPFLSWAPLPAPCDRRAFLARFAGSLGAAAAVSLAAGCAGAGGAGNTGSVGGRGGKGEADGSATAPGPATPAPAGGGPVPAGSPARARAAPGAPPRAPEVLVPAPESFWETLRRDFLLDPGLTYMNTGGLGPSPRPVIDTLFSQVRDLERVSESGHGRIEAVRSRAGRFLGCDEDEVAFTRSTTEGMNIIARGLPLEAGGEILLSTHEHPGGAMPWLALAKDKGLAVRLFEPGRGGADTLARIRSALTPRTRVLSVSHVMCTTGLRVPARKIANLCRARGIVSVFDGAQSAGQIPVDLHSMGCDFFATSGHKWLLGPKGTGLLYIRRAMLGTWRPTYVGAYSDAAYDLDALSLKYLPAARSTEYGTRSTPAVAALGAALDYLAAIGMERVAARGASLAAALRKHLEKMGSSFEILTPADREASASIVTFKPRRSKKNVWDWVNALKKKYRIRLRPVGEHKLKAIRASLHVFNSFQEIDLLAAALAEMAGR